MGEVSEAPRRLLLADARGAGMRVSWHAEEDLVVLSLWREDRCVGTFRMPPGEAATLAAFIVEHLGERAGR